MERREELRRFLRSRRAMIRPADVGLPATGRRRVQGLRREEVATLAGIGVSWYTMLENGEPIGVSEETVAAVGAALRLSPSEREYLSALVHGSPTGDLAGPDALVVAAMEGHGYPAYLISATWDVLAFNDAFRRVWAIGDDEGSFNAIERLFTHPLARPMHGDRFVENIRPVVSMLHSGYGRRPDLEPLRLLCERLLTDAVIRAIWDEDTITSPLVSNACTIDSPLGRFSYDSLTLPIPGMLYGLTVQVPRTPWPPGPAR
jgi:transcriptional regulator with XRE-family HTH domain